LVRFAGSNYRTWNLVSAGCGLLIIRRRLITESPRASLANGGDAMALEVEVLVRQRLLASPEVSALVGTRIFPVGGRPDKGPKAALPAITDRKSTRLNSSHV